MIVVERLLLLLGANVCWHFFTFALLPTDSRRMQIVSANMRAASIWSIRRSRELASSLLWYRSACIWAMYRFGGLLFQCVFSWSQQGRGTGEPDHALRITAITYAPIDSCVLQSSNARETDKKKAKHSSLSVVGNCLPSNGICIDERQTMKQDKYKAERASERTIAVLRHKSELWFDGHSVSDGFKNI